MFNILPMKPKNNFEFVHPFKSYGDKLLHRIKKFLKKVMRVFQTKLYNSPIVNYCEFETILSFY